MKKTKITALLLGILVGVSALSGCSGETDPAPSFVDINELNSNSSPQITPIYFEGNSDNSVLPNESESNTLENSSSIGDTQSENSANGSSSSDNSSITSDPQGGDKSAEVIIPK